MPLGCLPPACASSAGWLAAVIWMMAVCYLLSPRSPSGHPLISSLRRTVQILVDRIWRCWSDFLLGVELQWSETCAVRQGAAGYSTNKVDFGSPDSVAGEFFSSSSHRYGGDLERRWEVLRESIWCCRGVLMPINHGEQSRRPKFGRPTQMTNWWSSSKPAVASASPTSKWRPLLELAAALPVLPTPSGFVPGAGENGRGLSSRYSGECRGPDCVFQEIFEVFLVKVRDWTVIFFFFEIPDVNVPAPLSFNGI